MTVLVADNKAEAQELSAIADHLNIFGVTSNFDPFTGKLTTVASERSINIAKMWLNGTPEITMMYEVS